MGSFEAFAPLFPFEKSLLVGAVCRWEEDKCGAKKGLQTLQCCHRSDSSSLPQTPSVLPCLVPSTAGLHWNVVSSPQEGSSCFLLSICSNNDLLPVGQFVTDFFVLSISDNYEVL